MTQRTCNDRFWSKVEKTETCWLWTGGTARNGYGSFWDGNRIGRAHRYAYELLVGPIPEGLQLDHLCRVRLCVNPAHLEPVTQQENIRRAMVSRTHCKRGHEFTPENTVWLNAKHRRCRKCAYERPALPPCSVDDCDRPSWSRGWCKLHYMRWWYERRAAEAENTPPDPWTRCPRCGRRKTRTTTNGIPACGYHIGYVQQHAEDYKRSFDAAEAIGAFDGDSAFVAFLRKRIADTRATPRGKTYSSEEFLEKYGLADG